ncbi:transposase [Segnochrobactrum spirostomi]|uniref:Transposase n=1 Tax=Segnochrobactrum spirostomi TaxID=2608987 RepID=A0A6A7Y2Y7_9HYPH|nr:transposase [Segnochrobactrum spirostomi]MQT13075.1 transposase [Segnochrobactrum spirostomi]
MTISELTLKSSADEPVRRFEVFTGAGHRREWAPEEKARIVPESFQAIATVSEVARRHALSPQQLFTWRPETRKASETVPAFAPAVVAPAVVAPEIAPASKPSATC